MLNTTTGSQAEESCLPKQPEISIPDLIHDLRQPLSIIEACLYCMQRSLHVNEAAQVQLEMIAEQVEEAERILSRTAGALKPPAREATAITAIS